MPTPKVQRMLKRLLLDPEFQKLCAKTQANQKLFNAASQEYSADDTATMYNSTDTASTWYNDINPGNSVSGVIVFDLPKDQTPVSAELHDSAFSNGVKVNL